MEKTKGGHSGSTQKDTQHILNQEAHQLSYFLMTSVMWGHACAHTHDQVAWTASSNY